MLARLLAALCDDEGRVLIPGFYADVQPLTPSEQRLVLRCPTSTNA